MLILRAFHLLFAFALSQQYQSLIANKRAWQKVKALPHSQKTFGWANTNANSYKILFPKFKNQKVFLQQADFAKLKMQPSSLGKCAKSRIIIFPSFCYCYNILLPPSFRLYCFLKPWYSWFMSFYNLFHQKK